MASSRFSGENFRAYDLFFPPLHINVLAVVFLIPYTISFRLYSTVAQVIEDWKYVSMVFDRFFLWVFTLACIVGTCAIIFQAPSLYDQRQPIDFQLSSIPRRRSNLALPHEIDFYERTYGAD
jgi:hypothetical protein